MNKLRKISKLCRKYTSSRTEPNSRSSLYYNVACRTALLPRWSSCISANFYFRRDRDTMPQRLHLQKQRNSNSNKDYRCVWWTSIASLYRVAHTAGANHTFCLVQFRKRLSVRKELVQIEYYIPFKYNISHLYNFVTQKPIFFSTFLWMAQSLSILCTKNLL